MLVYAIPDGSRVLTVALLIIVRTTQPVEVEMPQQSREFLGT
jgi:hypothetical protein